MFAFFLLYLIPTLHNCLKVAYKVYKKVIR